MFTKKGSVKGGTLRVSVLLYSHFITADVRNPGRAIVLFSILSIILLMFITSNVLQNLCITHFNTTVFST